MLIWKGWGILMVPLFFAGIALSSFVVGQGWLPKTPYTVTGGVVLSALFIWLVGRIFRDDEGRINHSLFFIPWSFWPALVLVLACYTGYTAYSRHAAAQEDPLGFEVTGQTEYQHAVEVYKEEQKKLREVEAKLDSLTEAERHQYRVDVDRLRQRRKELHDLSLQFEPPEED